LSVQRGNKEQDGMGERVLMHDGGVGLPTLNRLWNSSKYGIPEGPAFDIKFIRGTCVVNQPG
jgi:hypothetical protein